MKRVLIISPYFPPVNAADMQRIRMSLPYYKEFGWEAEVVTVDPRYTDMNRDQLLNESIPHGIMVHYVKAFSKKWTSKIGLGSVALRSLPFFKRRVDRLLASKRFDLIYFSTTQFPVCILGNYWNKRFDIPYVIDMQDPWHSDFYEKHPKEVRPPKYWFAYQLNKRLEPIAMKRVGGLIAVSTGYLGTLEDRYQSCRLIPKQTIPFGAFAPDFTIAKQYEALQPSVLPPFNGKVRIVYIGRGGLDMQQAVSCLFESFLYGLRVESEIFKKIHFYFIGTSYATAGHGVGTIQPIADRKGMHNYVTEATDRIPFYQTLNTLADADGLFIPGSNDPQYTASKIYPYVLANKPLLAFFHPASSVIDFLHSCGTGTVLTFDQNANEIKEAMFQFLKAVASHTYNTIAPNTTVVEHYSAKTMTRRQCELFNEVIT